MWNYHGLSKSYQVVLELKYAMTYWQFITITDESYLRKGCLIKYELIMGKSSIYYYLFKNHLPTPETTKTWILIDRQILNRYNLKKYLNETVYNVIFNAFSGNDYHGAVVDLIH